MPKTALTPQDCPLLDEKGEPISVDRHETTENAWSGVWFKVAIFLAGICMAGFAEFAARGVKMERTDITVAHLSDAIKVNQEAIKEMVANLEKSNIKFDNRLESMGQQVTAISTDVRETKLHLSYIKEQIGGGPSSQ